MQLDKVTAELRPRNAWEAADLGARLVRRDAAAIYKTWFATSLPLLGIALGIVYFTPWPGYAIFVYWWFEPVLDGPLLDIVARRLFGGDARVSATIRATPRFAWRNRLFWLTPWRFHFARSTGMPLTQLEGLDGVARRKRAKILNESVFNYGIGITVVYQHLVLVVYIGILLSIFLFIPAPYQDLDIVDAAGSFWQSGSRHGEALNLCLFYIAQTLLEPWFVGAGFGLYINCRTRLEAWDIEVAFRRMVARRQPGAAAIVVIAIAAISWAPTEASEPVIENDPGFAGYWLDEDVDPALAVVMADEAFQEYELEERWVSKQGDEPEAQSREDADALEAFFARVGLFLGFLAEFGLWLLVGLLLLWIYARRDSWLPYLSIEPRSPRPAPGIVLSTGAVNAVDLPADIPGSARMLWAEGRDREAMSLLYRGSVFALVDRYGVRLPESATEGSCIAAVDEQASPSQSDLFRRIVAAWMQVAYGAQRPSAATFDELASSWPQYYGRPGR
jgi:hypothetical protein